VDRQEGKLIEELKAINQRAFGMALSVHKDPALRAQLAGEAHLLENKLLDIANELKRINPSLHQQWFLPISESLLDLLFVEGERETVSLRLGDLRKWG